MFCLQIYFLLQYYLKETSLNLENCIFGMHLKTQITFYQQDQEWLLLKIQP